MQTTHRSDHRVRGSGALPARQDSPARQEFEVPPPGKAAWITLVALAVVLPLAATAVAMWHEGVPSGSDFLAGAAIAAGVVVLGLMIGALVLRRSIVLEHGVLVVRAAMYTARHPVASIDLDAARTVNLDERTEYAPRWRTNGYSLPGFHAGYYRLRNGTPAFSLLTTRRRVLLLPVHGARTLLLSPRNPAALLDALRHCSAQGNAQGGPHGSGGG